MCLFACLFDFLLSFGMLFVCVSAFVVGLLCLVVFGVGDVLRFVCVCCPVLFVCVCVFVLCVSFD